MVRIRSDQYRESQRLHAIERYNTEEEYRRRKKERNNRHYQETKQLLGRCHGLTRTGAWKSRKSMRSRVLCESSFGHEAYRKFAIDPRWDSFVNFLEDMGPRPTGMTIDRKDNNLGYFKSNCRWATTKQQARNKTTNKLNAEKVCEIKEKIERQSYSEIAKDYGVHPATICDIAKGRTWMEEVASA